MKEMTCRQLGGACDKVFRAETFEEMAELSKKHGMEMLGRKDENHTAAMRQMQDLMQTPDGFRNWFEQKKQEFEALPDV